ncbi:PP2C family protein-serine/threonine phosphatase [bacterium]|jgi:phosphoserine phosphatase RsbU/P|nr:PP2C family protein-serine/threonine phosphatase [bacterium]
MRNPLIYLVILTFIGSNAWFIFDLWPTWSFPVSALITIGILLKINAGRTITNPLTTSITSPELSLTQTLPQNRLNDELAMAKRVQQGLLNIASPSLPGIKVAKKCTPAESVGGDFYSFINKDFQDVQSESENAENLGVVMGDVAGHGISSALIMALSSSLITEIGKRGKSPAQTLAKANMDLMRYIENSQITHVTVFYGIINNRTRQFTYSKGGHPPVILAHKDGSIEELDAEGVFLGMFENETFQDKSVQLQAGDRLYFYTDGLTETKSSSGELYGEDRFKDLIKSIHDTPIEEAITKIFSEVDQYGNYRKAKDDRSCVIVEVE